MLYFDHLVCAKSTSLLRRCARWLQHGMDAVLYTVQKNVCPASPAAKTLKGNSDCPKLHLYTARQQRHETQQPCSYISFKPSSFYHLSTAFRRGGWSQTVLSCCVDMGPRRLESNWRKGQSLVNSVEKEKISGSYYGHDAFFCPLRNVAYLQTARST